MGVRDYEPRERVSEEGRAVLRLDLGELDSVYGRMSGHLDA